MLMMGLALNETRGEVLARPHPIGRKLPSSFAMFMDTEMELGPPEHSHLLLLPILSSGFIAMFWSGFGPSSVEENNVGNHHHGYICLHVGSRDTQHSPSFGGHEEDEKQSPS
jgi:hypothetical protein